MLLGHLVVGNDIAAATYALLHDCYFLSTSEPPPFFSLNDFKILGHERQDVTWSRLNLLLSLTGKSLNYSNVENVRLTDEQIKISTSSGLYKYNFEKCSVFDPTGIELDNEIASTKPATYIVYDDFELSCLGDKHKTLSAKQTSENFGGKIYYYSSDRVDGASYVTDCVAVSTLSKEQLSDVNYSDSMARFVVERHLESIGICGNFVEMYKSGKPKYRKPKVLHNKRLSIPRDNNLYENTEKVVFCRMTLEEVIDSVSATRP